MAAPARRLAQIDADMDDRRRKIKASKSANNQAVARKRKRRKRSLLPSEAVMEYAYGVGSRDIVASRRFRQQVLRWGASLRDGADYRGGEIDELYEWMAVNLLFNNGPKQGTPVMLSPYQLLVCAMMLATYKSTKAHAERLYTELLWITGKGSTKTSTAAAVGIAFLSMERYVRRGTLLPVICRDGVQAKDTIFLDMGMYVELSESLDRFVFSKERRKYTLIENPDTMARSEPFSREAKTSGNVGGSNRRGLITAGLAIVDEYSDIPSTEAISQARLGMKGGQGQVWYMSNGGGYKDYPAYEHYKLACKVLDGAETADYLCPVLCEFDDPKKYRDEDEWLKANPMLDMGVPKSYYADATRTAAASDWLMGEHLRLMGAQWVEAKEGWINLDLWSECEDDDLKYDDFVGKPLYVPLDLSKSNDLCAYLVMAPDGKNDDGDDKYIAYLRAFTCAGVAGLVHKSEKDRIDYARMESMGYVSVTRTRTVDYSVLAQQMADDISVGSSAVVCYDTQFKQDFDTAADGVLPADLPQFPHPQQAMAHINDMDKLNMNRSITAAEELVVSGRLRFMPNPMMRIALGSAQLKVRPGGFRHFDRVKEKYDPAVCLAMGAGLVRLPAAVKGNTPAGDNPLSGMTREQAIDFLYGNAPKKEDE